MNEKKKKEIMIKSEMNLDSEWPIGSLSQKPNFKPLEFRDTIKDSHTGQIINRRWRIDGSLTHGTLIASDIEVLDVLKVIMHQQGIINSHINEICYTTYEFCKIAGWDICGKSYERHNMSIYRLFSASISGEFSYWDNVNKVLVPWFEGYHIVESCSLYGKKTGDKKIDVLINRDPFNCINFNAKYMESIRSSYVKLLDFDFLLSLSSPLSKRTFKYLDKMLYKKTEYRFNLKYLCFEHIGMSRSYNMYEAKRELSKALNELIDKGFLDSFIYDNKSVIIIKSKKKDSHKEAKKLISYFKEKSFNPPSSPTIREIENAERLIDEYEIDKARYIINYACRSGQQTNFKMKYFGAVMGYKDEAIEKLNNTENVRRLRAAEEKKSEKERIDIKKKKVEIERKYKQYLLLPDNKQKQLREQAVKNIKLNKQVVTEMGIKIGIYRLLKENL